ncbi:MAG: hypothetical protein A3J51_06870 [Omnitrophica WOR_2 bacterium RIFCSPHIGHO2_02_FULL_45_21]|nr:MAG: hypothetical protein A3J51_06870 [Omnitrophica WOR_2 bacterium RIFCSPHIGHO2_02_FULL_45_21]
MDSSVEIMQFIMDLKIQHPDNVYYVLGNHDYLSDLFSKGKGQDRVWQGILYSEKLQELYGEDYITAYENFIKASPLMVMGNGFIAVHGGPITNANFAEIQNVDVGNEGNPIVEQAEWGRYQDSYDDRDVQEFLNNMGQPRAQLIVGHSPRRDRNWHWQPLPNHHIVFAGHDRAGYAVVQNGRVDFIEVTDASSNLELVDKKLETEETGQKGVKKEKSALEDGMRREGKGESEIRLGKPGATILETLFTGDVWIIAGSFAYKISVTRNSINFQRYKDDKSYPVGDAYNMQLDQPMQIGRETGNYRLSDELLSGKHFIIKISRNGNNEFSLFVEDLNSLNGTTVEWNNAASSPLTNSPAKTESSKQEEAVRSLGGIDFRSLPIVAQAVTNLSGMFRDSPLRGLSLLQVNLAGEWQEIGRMVSSGITPSSERIKEYIQTSCAQDNITQDRNKILLCISDILRQEEERSDHTEDTLRDILVVLESMSSGQELGQVFLGKVS